MANYAYVVDNTIESVYELIPNNWKNTSNFYALTDEERETLSWYKIVKAYPEYNSATHTLDNPRHYFIDGVAYEAMDVIELPIVVVPQLSDEAVNIQQQYETDVQWRLIRGERAVKMLSFEWRYTRYDRQIRLGETPDDDIVLMDAYMKALSDITTQTDPFRIIWPEFGV